MAPRSVHFGERSRKLSYLALLRASEGILSRWSRLHLQSSATNPHWARVVGYGPFSCIIHKEGLCPSSGDINRLMMTRCIGIHLVISGSKGIKRDSNHATYIHTTQALSPKGSRGISDIPRHPRFNKMS
jgi:hypothetical protein